MYKDQQITKHQILKQIRWIEMFPYLKLYKVIWQKHLTKVTAINEVSTF